MTRVHKTIVAIFLLLALALQTVPLVGAVSAEDLRTEELSSEVIGSSQKSEEPAGCTRIYAERPLVVANSE